MSVNNPKNLETGLSALFGTMLLQSLREEQDAGNLKILKKPEEPKPLTRWQWFLDVTGLKKAPPPPEPEEMLIDWQDVPVSELAELGKPLLEEHLYRMILAKRELIEAQTPTDPEIIVEANKVIRDESFLEYLKDVEIPEEDRNRAMSENMLTVFDFIKMTYPEILSNAGGDKIDKLVVEKVKAEAGKAILTSKSDMGIGVKDCETPSLLVSVFVHELMHNITDGYGLTATGNIALFSSVSFDNVSASEFNSDVAVIGTLAALSENSEEFNTWFAEYITATKFEKSHKEVFDNGGISDEPHNSSRAFVYEIVQACMSDDIDLREVSPIIFRESVRHLAAEAGGRDKIKVNYNEYIKNVVDKINNSRYMRDLGKEFTLSDVDPGKAYSRKEIPIPRVVVSSTSA